MQVKTQNHTRENETVTKWTKTVQRFSNVRLHYITQQKETLLSAEWLSWNREDNTKLAWNWASLICGL